MRRLLIGLMLLMVVMGFPGHARAGDLSKISGTVEFRVMQQLDRAPWYKVIPGAQVLVIGPDGRLMATGVTDGAGTWSARVTVAADPRFAPSRALGTVTAIAVADGYVERLVFDVPVVTHGEVQVIRLKPIKPNQRNEPGYELGALHRLWVLPLLDHYAEQAHLGKQRPVEGDWNSPHWGPAWRAWPGLTLEGLRTWCHRTYRCQVALSQVFKASGPVWR